MKLKRTSTMFARIVLYLVGIGVLAVCFILIPELVREEGVGKPFNPYFIYSFFAGVYVLATVFFVALYQTFKLLHYIDKNKAFSMQSLKTLQNIKICALVFAILIVTAVIAGISFVKNIDPREDVTPFITIGFVFTFASSVIAVFAAVLQKLLGEAVALKAENDLIV